MMSRLLLSFAMVLVLDGCLPMWRQSGPKAYSNGVATDSMEAAAMLRHFNVTKCPLDDMRVRDRPDVQINAVQVDGCGATRVYACSNEVGQQHLRYVTTRYVCGDLDGASLARPSSSTGTKTLIDGWNRPLTLDRSRFRTRQIRYVSADRSPAVATRRGPET